MWKVDIFSYMLLWSVLLYNFINIYEILYVDYIYVLTQSIIFILAEYPKAKTERITIITRLFLWRTSMQEKFWLTIDQILDGFFACNMNIPILIQFRNENLFEICKTGEIFAEWELYVQTIHTIFIIEVYPLKATNLPAKPRLS